jgi:hypothetical protein
MKKILVLCGSILVLGAGYLTWLHSRPEHYGRPFSNAPEVTIAQLNKNQVAGDVQVKGKIVRQCPVSGCWFYLDDGKGSQVKVDLGKTMPQLPKKIGHEAKAEGRLVQTGDQLVLVGSSVEFQ